MNMMRQLGIVILICLHVSFLWGKDDSFILAKTSNSYSITEVENNGFFENCITYLNEAIKIQLATSTNNNIKEANYPKSVDFYRPEVCQLSVSVSQNGCTDNNNGTFTANYDVNLSWIDGPAEAIQIIVNGVVAQTITSGSASPQTVPITLSADGIGQDTIVATFATTTSCSDTLIIKSLNPCPSDVTSCAASTGCIGGKAFDDFNRNGIDDTNESGIQGINVVVYDCQNVAVDTVWTDSDGDWQVCSLTDGDAYRVEFIIPESIACWANPSHAGVDNGTDVQFLTAPACTKFGLSNPNDFAEEDPYIIIPCFSDGVYNGGNSAEPAIVKLKESADGHDFTGVTKTVDFEAVTLATHNDVGAVYGVAWQPTKERYYLSTFHKRYVGYGPDGPDAIYQYDINGNKTGTINLDAILATSSSTGGDVHDFTPAPITDNNPGEIYDLGVGEISYDGVGKLAFGDIEMSSDNSTLYVVNLFDKKIYALDISSGNTANTTVIQSWDTPDETTAGRNRPFALAAHEGKLFIGSVDENGSNAYVHSLLPTTNTFNLELTIPLDYDRQAFIDEAYFPDALSNWNAWATTADVPYGGVVGALNEIGYPQPILSDIEFASNGDMILGFRDRFGDQSGSGRFLNPDETQISFSISAGDILKACLQSGNYVLETAGGSCAGAGGISPSGPGGTEFYSWDFYNYQDPWSPIKPLGNESTPGYVSGGIHWETTQGALLQLKGRPYIITTAMDPFSDYSGGLLKFNNTTGGREGVALDSANLADLVGGYTLFDTNEFPPVNGSISFGKANGLGDLEAATKPAPLEIGNYVWCDSLRNGIQDACERGISDIIVQLYDRNGVLVGQDTTVNGQYYFNQFNIDTTGISVDGSGNATPTTAWSGMSYSTQYFVVFGGGQFASDEFTVGSETYGITSIVNAGTNDNIDSDVDGASLTLGSLGARPNGLPFIDLTTNVTGTGDHKYDLGVVCTPDYDYGDLPDMGSGTTGIRDYETYDANGGPSHEIIDGLFLGAIVDADIDGVPDTLAVGDDNLDSNDDEDGVTIFPSLNISPGGTMKLPLSVTNTTGNVAYVEAWIDWNGDGKFDGPNEMVADYFDEADGIFPLIMDIMVPTDAITGSLLGFRVRLSNTDNMTPYGRINSGEVEDYLIGIDCPQVTCLPAEFELLKDK